MKTTVPPRPDAIQCEAGAILLTSTGYKCCEYHTPQITKGKNREDVKPLTTDTQRTDAVWKLTPFASALLEHDGETCNEIFCADADEAECLVDLLNELTNRAEDAEDDLTRTQIEMQLEIDKAEADAAILKEAFKGVDNEFEKLEANLRRAIEIAEGMTGTKRQFTELNQIKATLNPTKK